MVAKAPRSQASATAIDEPGRDAVARVSAGQAAILEMIAADAPLQDSLRALILLIEANCPAMLGSILLVDEEGRLHHGSAPSLPAAFVRAVEGLPVGPSAGSCGTAIHRRRAVITEDIERDPLWHAYRADALPHGLRACWSTPIFDAERKVLGSFAFYFRKAGRPTARHDALIRIAAHTASIAIVRLRDGRERERLLHDLGERVKELTVLHEASRLLQAGRAIDAELLGRLAALLPTGLRFPDDACARVTCDGMVAATQGWRSTAWQLSAPVRGQDGPVGAIEVAYLTEHAPVEGGAFLREERHLLDSVASMIAAHLERIRVQSTLRNRENMFRSVFESAAIGMTLVDLDQRILRANTSFARMLGHEPENLKGRSFNEFTLPQDRDENTRQYRELAAGRIENFQLDKRYVHRDGSLIWGRVTVSRMPQEGNSPPYTIGMIEDITARKKGDGELQRFRAAMDVSGDAILLVDRASLRYVDVNQTFCDLVGYAREELLRMTPMDLFSADRETLELDYDAIIADIHAPASRVEGSYRRKDGSLLPIETRRRALRTENGWIIVGMARDISERRQAEQRIQYLATHDELTGLPNRALIQDRIAQAISHARRVQRQLALLYLDLDRFKIVNDGFGHPFGDRVLRAAGERLVRLVREGDTVARLGGDEFLILLADLRRAEDAYIVAEKIVENFGQPIVLEDREVHYSGSIGVSVFPQDGETPDALISNADAAMYRAKELGRNNYQFYTREMSDETKRRVDLENKLRGAAAAGQLQLAYQPKVSLDSGQITGCEALLRWQHPELGAVSPARFIPIAEDSGLIVPIGDWVLRTACAQARAWTDAGLPPISVAVNISARQFLQQDVVAWVLRTLEETGLAPHQLELELTESLIAQDVEKVIATINHLKAAGAKLSIDDFGTGYSSLSYLKRFRVDTLKIDQSFVRNMLNEMDDATIVLAVISLAHNLKFRVIAEGVETKEHCRFLRLNRCDEMQGYYFSKPVPAAEMEALLRAGKRLE